jgi:capsular polysaccharide biosynthesis protein
MKMKDIKKIYNKRKMLIWIVGIVAVVVIAVALTTDAFSIFGSYWTRKPF